MAKKEDVEAIVVPRSTTGNSIYDVERIDSSNISDFLPDPDRRADAAGRLRGLGFAVHDYGGPAIVIRAPSEVFRRVFKNPEQGSQTLQKSEFTELANTIDRANPTSSFRLHQTLSPTPPPVGYHSFDVPDGLASAVQATPDQLDGLSGKGVRIAICDSGWYRHPWFDHHGFSVTPRSLPGTGPADADAIGHGTAVAASLLSVAPGCHVTSIKMHFGTSTNASSDAVLSLQAASNSGADIINCSWGSNIPTRDAVTPDIRDLEYVITALNHAGRVIVSTSGNFPRHDPESHGDFGYPGQHPDVISVGGCYIDETGALTASEYASGFLSSIYDQRPVPDVCGLCGPLPAGVLIASPVPPSSIIDQQAAAAAFPNGDNTAPDDGWAYLSGTSLAAPQVAGVLALMMEANPEIRDTHRLRDLLKQTARDVTTGSSNPRAVHPGDSNDARPGSDLATGAGLVSALAAVAATRAC